MIHKIETFKVVYHVGILDNFSEFMSRISKSYIKLTDSNNTSDDEPACKIQ